jgi:hypothetical protein
MKSRIPLVDLDRLEHVIAQMERRGVKYGLGAKAEGGKHPETGRRFNPRSNGTISTPVSSIDNIDCSGLVRYALHYATKGALRIPDGSQRQREWCEDMARLGLLHPVGRYADAAKHMTGKRLFICFIKPFTNGCGPVGHVWLLSQYDDGDNGTPAGTLESHGGVGVNSRAWNSRTLVREFYSCYELLTVQGAA